MRRPSLTEHLINVDAVDAFERKKLRGMDEKFCERLVAAIEHGQERMPANFRHARLVTPKKMARNA